MTELKQRSNLWRRLRIGDITASRFGDVLTTPLAKGVFAVDGERGGWRVVANGEIIIGDYTRKADADEKRAELAAEWRKTHWSQTAESYLDEKLSEWINGQPADVWKADAVEWGTANEPYAFEAALPVIQERFGQSLSTPVDECAYIHHATEPYIGCSPDGIIGDDGLLELKCPYSGAKWIRAKRAFDRGEWTVPAENLAQVQGSLWVADRSWYAFCYFDPRVRASGLDPLLMIKVERDDDYINNVLAPRICAFRDYLVTTYHAMIGGKAPF
uniref:Putative exonuclease n=1 Tax=viral metagenome TaxID=1070528 RepID=A0A6M3LVG4_9ZZZZ